uniref:GrBNV_gp48-like protein n=1 Tax=Nilaparvata lugens endogenous nudivirus TaxID=1487700 RepID=X5GE97_9VIRU|nr:GrBNV_gp48-like protein [Nilaparvata lugens endogenous nudivirus]
MSVQKKSRLLYVDNLLKIFYNYEPTRIKLWEIVRTFDSKHIAALIFILSNVNRSKNNSVYTHKLIENLIKETNEKIDGVVHKLCVQPTLNVVRVRSIYETYACADNSNNDVFLDRVNNQLTIWGLMSLIRAGNTLGGGGDDELTIDERLVMHNISSTYYIQFINNIRNLLFRDESMIDDRNNVQRVAQSKLVTENFLQYYNAIHTATQHDPRVVDRHYVENSLNRQTQSLMQNQFVALTSDIDPKNFRYIIRPRPLRCYDKFLDVIMRCAKDTVVVQPLYRGFFVVINSTGNQTRCYNRYGDLQYGLLYDTKFNVSATFEAVILPVDETGNIRNWNYWEYRHSTAVYITDVFRYKQTVATNLTYSQRYAYASQIGGVSVRTLFNCNESSSPVDVWSKLQQEYNDRPYDMMDPIGGLIVRASTNCDLSVPPIEYRFNMKTYYDFASDTFENVVGSISLKNSYNITFDMEMATYRTVCLVYAHDTTHLYTCAYDRNTTFQFYHVSKLPRLLNIKSLKTPIYRPETLYILGAKINQLGLCYVRVYYNHINEIVGYDYKSTTSMYDVPYNCVF